MKETKTCKEKTGYYVLIWIATALNDGGSNIALYQPVAQVLQQNIDFR